MPDPNQDFIDAVYSAENKKEEEDPLASATQFAVSMNKAQQQYQQNKLQFQTNNAQVYQQQYQTMKQHLALQKHYQMQPFPQYGEEPISWPGRATRAVQDFTINALNVLPEGVKKPLRQAVGRVATNVVYPYSYGSIDDIRKSKLDEVAPLFNRRNLPHTLWSIVKDQPAYDEEVGRSPEDGVNARRPLFREYFDLPTQDVDRVYNHLGKDYWINPETTNIPAQRSIDQMTRPDKFMTDYGYEVEDTGQQRWNPISGNFIKGQPDPWDFNVNSFERRNQKAPYTSEQYIRSLVTAIGNPARLMTGGYTNPEPNENEDAMPDEIAWR